MRLCIGLEFYFLQQPYAHRKNNMRPQIFIDIRAGIPPAIRQQPPHPQEEPIWRLLDLCWKRRPTDRTDARNLLARLEPSGTIKPLASFDQPSTVLSSPANQESAHSLVYQESGNWNFDTRHDNISRVSSNPFSYFDPGEEKDLEALIHQIAFVCSLVLAFNGYKMCSAVS